MESNSGPRRRRTVPGWSSVHAAPESHGTCLCYNVAQSEVSHAAAVITTGLNVGSEHLLLPVWTLAVWAFFGGTHQPHRRGPIGGRRAGWSCPRALWFVWRKWLSVSPLPLLGVLAAAGSVGNFGVAHAVGRPGRRHCDRRAWLLFLLAGLMMALLLLGSFAFGWPLMWSSLLAGRTDAFGRLELLLRLPVSSSPFALSFTYHVCPCPAGLGLGRGGFGGVIGLPTGRWPGDAAGRVWK